MRNIKLVTWSLKFVIVALVFLAFILPCPAHDSFILTSEAKSESNPFLLDMAETGMKELDPEKNPTNLTIFLANKEHPNQVSAIGTLGTHLSMSPDKSTMKSLHTSPGAKLTIRLRADTPAKQVVILGKSLGNGSYGIDKNGNVTTQ
jgi:hypothetical protein